MALNVYTCTDAWISVICVPFRHGDLQCRRTIITKDDLGNIFVCLKLHDWIISFISQNYWLHRLLFLHLNTSAMTASCLDSGCSRHGASCCCLRASGCRRRRVLKTVDYFQTLTDVMTVFFDTFRLCGVPCQQTLLRQNLLHARDVIGEVVINELWTLHVTSAARFLLPTPPLAPDAVDSQQGAVRAGVQWHRRDAHVLEDVTARDVVLLEDLLRKFTHLIFLGDAEFKAQGDKHQHLKSHVSFDVFTRKTNSRLTANLIFPENLFPKLLCR